MKNPAALGHVPLRIYSTSSLWQGVAYLTLLAFILLLPACTTVRVNQFKQFAEAGMAYADATDVLTKEAGNAVIDTDSAVLIKTRETLPLEERGKTILEHNNLMKDRLLLLADLRHHARLLRTYFVALGALAESNAPSGIGTTAKEVVKALETTSKRIEKAKFGAQPVSNFTGSVVNIFVAKFREAALERELKARAAALERELDLQQAAMEAIAVQMRTDLKAILLRQESTDIVSPFRSSANTLPKEWAKRRRELLTTNLSLASVNAATEAAKNLKLSFVALAENRFQYSDLEVLFKDINEILTFVEAVQVNKEN